MDKKATSTVPAIVIILIFFVAAVSLSTYLTSSSKEEKVGSNALSALSLINNAENELVYLDSIVRISANEASQDLFLKFYAKNCNKEEDYIILDSSCPANYSQIINNFNLFFKEELKNHIEKAPYKFKDDYFVTSKFGKILIVEGKANYKLEYQEKNAFYSIYPNFKQEINVDLSVLDNIFKEIDSKSSCLSKTSFNELIDAEDKLAEECSFSKDYIWSIKKKDNLALFYIKVPNNLYTKFTISLNTNSA